MEYVRLAQNANTKIGIWDNKKFARSHDWYEMISARCRRYVQRQFITSRLKGSTVGRFEWLADNVYRFNYRHFSCVFCRNDIDRPKTAHEPCVIHSRRRKIIAPYSLPMMRQANDFVLGTDRRMLTSFVDSINQEASR